MSKTWLNPGITSLDVGETARNIDVYAEPDGAFGDIFADPENNHPVDGKGKPQGSICPACS